MTWDKTKPTAPPTSETLKLGDDRIRETKEDFQNAVDDEKIFPGPNPLNAPVCYDKIPYGTLAQRPAANASNGGRFYVNTDDGTIEYDSGGAWEAITCPKDLFPSGSVIAFYQASPPTGWSQMTDAGLNDVTIRIVSGPGATTGGTDSISIPPTHDHGLVTGSQSIDHTHTNSGNQTVVGAGITYQAPAFSSPLVSSTGTTSDTAHDHSLAAAQAFAPAYLDFILAVRA